MISRTRARKGTSKTTTTQRRRTQPANKEVDDAYDLRITMKETHRSQVTIVLWRWH